MMIVAFVLRTVLAGVLVASGLLKSVTVAETAQAVRDFGLARRIARPLAVILPPIELAVAALLLGDTSARVGTVAASAMLLAFLAITAAAVATGRTVACNCFGARSGQTVTARTVARNAGLVAAAVAAAALTFADPRPRGVPWGRFGPTEWAVVVLAAAVGLLAVAFWRTVTALLEQHGRLLARLDALGGTPSPASVADVTDGLPVGTPAPAFALPRLDGAEVTLDSLVGATPKLLLLFSDPHCGPCTELMSSVAHWQQGHADELAVVVIASGSRADNEQKMREYGLAAPLLDTDRAVATAYRSPGTPSAVLVDPDGRVAAGAAGAPAIQELVSTSLGDHAPVVIAPSPLGRAAPEFALPDLGGSIVTAAWFGLHEYTVLLFWNPTCGFCQRMETRLQRWDLVSRAAERSLLVVTTGDAAVSAGLQTLHSPTVIDDGTLTRHYEASGTPMAVLIDAAGRQRSELAAGEAAVFDLLGTRALDPDLVLPVIEGASS